MKNLKIEISNKTCIVSINRLKNLNAINLDLLMELKEVLTQYQNSKQIRTMILTGEGEQAFIAGADIKSMSKMSSEQAYDFSKLGNDITLMMDQYPKPIIAAINGYALGGGCEFAMACHIRFASENAMIGQPETGLGLIPGFGGTQRLPRIVGLTNAYNLLLSGQSINAMEAKRIGLVSDVFNQSELLDRTVKFAEKINKNSPFSSKIIIEAINMGVHLNLQEALEIESQYFKKVFNNENKNIGIESFLNKIKPEFID